MTEVRRSAVTAIQSSIDGYVRANPNAADSAIGIHAWWLPPHLSERTRDEEVTQALESLVSAGDLEQTRTPGGHNVYSHSRERNHSESPHGAAEET